MRKKLIIITILIILSILIVATIFSILKFNVFNPISSFFAMTEIIFTDKDCTIVQTFPKRVMFSKPNVENYTAKDLLDIYMDNRGFNESKEEQLGGSLVYYNGEVKEYIDFSVNNYYSKWQWK